MDFVILKLRRDIKPLPTKGSRVTHQILRLRNASHSYAQDDTPLCSVILSGTPTFVLSF